MWGPRSKPGERWIFGSYAQALSTEHSLKRRTLLEHPWYQRLWGELVTLVHDQNEKTNFQNTRRGMMLATSMNGAGLGFGGNWIVIDDPHNTKQITSRVERQAAIDVFDQTFSRRLDDKMKGVMVVIMQRLAVDDLTGHCLELGGFTHLKIPAEAKPNERIFLPFSKTCHEREEGELLWPEREGPAQIAEAKRFLGTRGYAGQYDQEPVPLGGTVFLTEWFSHWYKALPKLRFVCQSWDTAWKTASANDYSVCTTWGVSEDNRIYLMDVLRERLTSPELKKMMTALWRKRVAHVILVEDAASGTGLIQEFQSGVRMSNGQILHLPVIACKSSTDKLARAEAVAPMIESGMVYFPDTDEVDAPWFADYLIEMMRFTGLNDPHDDQVDSTTQALNYLRDQVTGFAEIIQTYKEMAEGSKKLHLCANCHQEIGINEAYRAEWGGHFHHRCPSIVVPFPKRDDEGW
jgi:predicted phage terminase large subunit-like protein